MLWERQKPSLLPPGAPLSLLLTHPSPLTRQYFFILFEHLNTYIYIYLYYFMWCWYTGCCLYILMFLLFYAVLTNYIICLILSTWVILDLGFSLIRIYDYMSYHFIKHSFTFTIYVVLVVFIFCIKFHNCGIL